MTRKYEFTGEKKIVLGTTLRRIRATISIRGEVSVGDDGGWIEGEKNLDHNGDAWVSDNARVYGDARVRDNAKVYGDAKVYDNAQVRDNAKVYGYAKVYSNATVCGNAQVCGYARVRDNARVSGNAQVYGDAVVYGYAWVRDNAMTEGARGNDCVPGKGSRPHARARALALEMALELRGPMDGHREVLSYASEVLAWLEGGS
jgi:NDP-sugar pyrophosphorylase family protein|tara:strand:- start:482 stop:1087 length:606 start_codon:yes stop_codon:yes gene_type:complete